VLRQIETLELVVRLDAERAEHRLQREDRTCPDRLLADRASAKGSCANLRFARMIARK
jgi:hypothetical protein